MGVKIKELPKEDRPRERLIKYGANILSNEELLSILIKSGAKNKSAKEIAQTLLSKFDNVQDFSQITYEELLKVKGMGESKACTIMAAIELGNRFHKTIPSLEKKKLNNSDLVFDYYKDTLSMKKQEHFYCIYVDSQKCFLKEALLFVGTLNYSLVHPREVFKEAYVVGAAGIICIHNHPSGNVTPSKEDIILTDRLKEIGMLQGVPILDHIIIGKDSYYSFFESGKL